MTITERTLKQWRKDALKAQQILKREHSQTVVVTDKEINTYVDRILHMTQELLNQYIFKKGVKAMFEDLEVKCKNCGCTRGSHSASEYYSNRYEMHVPFDYCPGHEGRMDWDKGPGTVFEPVEDKDEN